MTTNELYRLEDKAENTYNAYLAASNGGDNPGNARQEWLASRRAYDAHMKALEVVILSDMEQELAK